MSANAIKVTKCRICEGEKFTEVIDLEDQYVVDFVANPDSDVFKAPLRLVRCAKCNLVQLDHTVNADRLYRNFWYRSGINEQMRAALENVVTCASNLVTLTSKDSVLDIGSNDGELLGWYTDKVKTVGVDPCEALVDMSMEHHKVDVGLKGYFSKPLVEAHGPYKIITAVAMFYDIGDPVKFLKECKDVLHEDGILVIQMNYLPAMLKNVAVDNIGHEHLTYYSLQSLMVATNLADLDVVGADQNDVNGGSFRVYLMHKGKGLVSHEKQMATYMRFLTMLHEEQKLELDKDEIYVEFNQNAATQLSALERYLVQESDAGAKIFLYGASTRGTVLMQLLNLPDGVIRGVAERDSNKYNLHMVGGVWPTIYPEPYVRMTATHLLVLPYHFKETIVKREASWVKSGGTLIFPLPRLHEVGPTGTKFLSLEEKVEV